MNDFALYSKNEQALMRGLEALPVSDQEKITSAWVLAARCHEGQSRIAEDDENRGYIIHPVRVARWLLEHGVRDTDMLVAALLHDTLEDTPLDPDEIRSRFGSGALALVQAVTRPRPQNESESDKRTSKPRHYRHLLTCDERVRLLKTADMLDNMRSWPTMGATHSLSEKFPRWVDEANGYYIPIAQSVHAEAADEMKTIVRFVEQRL